MISSNNVIKTDCYWSSGQSGQGVDKHVISETS